MGGVAFKAPVLATLFLIITFANLAMPGSSNFIGEFMILLGTFDSHIAIALIASVAVVGAAFYALRLFIGAMHNRVGGRVRSFEIKRSEAIAIVPLCLIILALAFYPQFGLNKSETTMKVAMYPAAAVAATRPTRCRARPRRCAQHRAIHAAADDAAYTARSRPTSTHELTVLAAAHIKGPHIDWAELSPLIVLAVGALVVLLVGLAGSRDRSRAIVPRCRW